MNFRLRTLLEDNHDKAGNYRGERAIIQRRSCGLPEYRGAPIRANDTAHGGASGQVRDLIVAVEHYRFATEDCDGPRVTRLG
jgi:hypothetical protein